MALLEKQIDFAVVFIQLYNKPEWYKELVPTTLVPAVDIRRGAQSRGIVYESLDILKARLSAAAAAPSKATYDMPDSVIDTAGCWHCICRMQTVRIYIWFQYIIYILMETIFLDYALPRRTG